MMESEVTNETNILETEFRLMESHSLWAATYLKIRQESMKKDHPSDEAKKPDNKLLNRYRDVNPYDHSRVILTKPGYNYINASYIPVEGARRKYILTQGPLSNTIRHFWLMVWQENSKAIIMLNKLIEKNQSKCCQYWPGSSEEGEALELPEVELRVELLREITFSHYILRKLRLTNTAADESREIIQFHYTTWPDFGVPQSPLAFLKFLRDIRQCGAFGFEYGPPIVHCSAGIGRSGTFCLVDSCLVLMKEKGIEHVNVKNVLLEMRNYRMGLIQTPEQLRFSYIAIIQGLKVDWNAEDDAKEGDAIQEENVEAAIVTTSISFTKPPDGLPQDDISRLINDVDTQKNDAKLSSDSEDEPPPLPPPRSFIEKPLPVLPNDSPSDSETEEESASCDSDVDTVETRLIEDASSEEVVTVEDGDLNSNEPILAEIRASPTPFMRPLVAHQTNLQTYHPPTVRAINSVPASRKRKHLDSQGKSNSISDKVQDVAKKPVDAEKWKKIRSIFINLSSGISFVAVFGAALAYIWYRRTA